MKTLWIFLLLFCSSFIPSSQSPVSLQGKVVGIKDGDSIEVLIDQKPQVIRLAHIDCPEIRSRQPFGQQAKQKTSELCFGQTVTLHTDKKKDRYNRTIAVVINEAGHNINLELVKAGLAWHFTQYSSDTIYANAEKLARSQKIAIWSQNDAIAPWLWRKPKK